MTIVQSQVLPEQGAKETKDQRGQTVGVWNRLRRPYGDTRARRLRDGTRGGRLSRDRQKEAENSNVDSGELLVQSVRLKYY